MAEVWTITAKHGSRNPGFAAWHHGHVVAYAPTVEEVWVWLVRRGASPERIVVPQKASA